MEIQNMRPDGFDVVKVLGAYDIDDSPTTGAIVTTMGELRKLLTHLELMNVECPDTQAFAVRVEDGRMVRVACTVEDVLEQTCLSLDHDEVMAWK